MLPSKITSDTLLNLTRTGNKTGNDLLSGLGQNFADVLQSLTESQEQTDSLMEIGRASCRERV